MSSWTRQILSELRGDAARRPSETKHRAHAAARPASVVADSAETDSLDCIDFGAKLVSLSELARVSGIGEKLLRNLVRAGKLRPLRVPGSQRLRYSPQQFVEIIKRENQSFY